MSNYDELSGNAEKERENVTITCGSNDIKEKIYRSHEYENKIYINNIDNDESVNIFESEKIKERNSPNLGGDGSAFDNKSQKNSTRENGHI